MYLKKTIFDINLTSKKVLLRLDLNVPISNGRIVDNNRIVKTLPTILHLLKQGCQIFVLSHLGRIKSLDDINSGKKSLKIVAEQIDALLCKTYNVVFVEHTDFGKIREKVDNNPNANIFVLENTRYYDVNALNENVKWESKNFPELSNFWSSLADVFINDAFGTMHRAHASNVGLAEQISDSAIGFLVEKEINNLNKALTAEKENKIVILGGSKVSDKLKLIKSIIPKVDKLIIGGGMAYTFLKSQKKEVGKSIVEAEMIEECKSLLIQYSDKILLPVDHLVVDSFGDKKAKIFSADKKDWGDNMALDIGPKTIDLFSSELEKSKVVIWNGPMGVFEFSNFENGTKFVAQKLTEITKKGSYTVIGGGDSAAAAAKFQLTNGISFISTGGGASLVFFEGSKMPGLDAIPNKNDKI